MIKDIRQSEFYRERWKNSEQPIRVFYEKGDPNLVVTEENLPELIEKTMVNYFRDKMLVEKVRLSGYSDMDNQDLRVLIFHETRLKKLMGKPIQNIFTFVMDPNADVEKQIDEVQDDENFTCWYL